jgi:hypothetical protein
MPSWSVSETMGCNPNLEICFRSTSRAVAGVRGGVQAGEASHEHRFPRNQIAQLPGGPLVASAVGVARLVELRVQNHPRNLHDSALRQAQGTRLPSRPLGAANHILVLPLNPKMRWIVGNVRQDRYQGRAESIGPFPASSRAGA